MSKLTIAHELYRNTIQISGLSILCIAVALSSQLYWLSSHGLLFQFGELGLRIPLALVVGGGLAWFFSILLRKGLLNPAFSLSGPIAQRFCVGTSIIVLTSMAAYPNHPFVTLGILLGYLSNLICFDRARKEPTQISPKFIHRLLCWGIFLVSVASIYFREPALFHYPRFWAEDGMFFFAHFFNNRGPMELFWGFEYYRLIHNLTAYIAVQYVALAEAPLVFTLVAAFFTAIPIAIVSFGRSSYWEAVPKKILIIALYLLVPFSQETWLNLNGISYTLTLVSALILMSQVTPANLWPYRACLMFAGLSGVLSCLFTPFFGVRAWIKRDKEHLVQFLLLCVCSVIQFSVVFYSDYMTGEGIDMRITPPSAETTVLVVWLRTLLTAVSLPATIYCANAFTSGLSFPDLYLQYSLIYGLITLGILGFYVRGTCDLGVALLAGCFLLLAVFSTVFGVGGPGNTAFLHITNGMRYFYIPAVMVTLVMASPILCAANPTLMLKKQIAIYGLMALIIHNGVDGYGYLNVYEQAWPKWEEQTNRWLENPQHPIQIAPAGFKMHLTPPGDK